jgi:L-ascorbate metabolism protein UlaG (beta-lactamase superfamily)
MHILLEVCDRFREWSVGGECGGSAAGPYMYVRDTDTLSLTHTGDAHTTQRDCQKPRDVVLTPVGLSVLLVEEPVSRV